MTNKYEPLTDFLKSNPRIQIKLNFDLIETIISESLPPSARKHHAWWTNPQMQKVFGNAGYGVDRVLMRNEEIHLLMTREEIARRRHNKSSLQNNEDNEKQREALRLEIEEDYKTDIDELKKRERYFRLEKNVYRKAFRRALAMLMVVTVSLISYGLLAIVFMKKASFPDSPLDIMPWFTALGFIIFPLVWLGRQYAAQVEKAEILEQEFFGRAYLEQRMLLHYGGEDGGLREAILKDYSHSWVHNSLSDKLMSFKKKQGDPAKVHPVERAWDTLKSSEK